MKYLPLIVVLLAIQTVSSQTLLSGLCTNLGFILCTSAALGAEIGSSTSLTVDTNFTVNTALTLQSVTTSASSSSSAIILVAGGATLQISNALTVAASTSVVVLGSLVVQGSASVSGSVQIESSSNSASAQFESGLALQAGANFVLYGSAAVSGSLTIASNAVVNIASGGVATINSNVNNAAGDVTVSGTLLVNTGSSSTSYTQTGGNLILGDSDSSSTSTGVHSNVTIDAGATLSGTGNINGNLVVASNATVSPGNSPGTTFVNGDITFSSGSTYKFEVDNSNNKYDRIVASGTANLGGFVHCTFLNSVPGTTSYNALAYSSRTGKFQSVYGDITYAFKWSENDNTAISTQFVFSNSSTKITFSLLVVLLGLAASLL